MPEQHLPFSKRESVDLVAVVDLGMGCLDRDERQRTRIEQEYESPFTRRLAGIPERLERGRLLAADRTEYGVRNAVVMLAVFRRVVAIENRAAIGHVLLDLERHEAPAPSPIDAGCAEEGRRRDHLRLRGGRPRGLL